ncbi:MAG: TlpA family protein disulfide reductase [Bdellovibrionaceae bacterium]|jgi:peroxiredoxin|nr:TlpA family protein disulfide reductase [Pseudobdellovibrionaceae bacterium]
MNLKVKKYSKYVSDILVVALFVFVVYRQGPTIYNSFKQQDQKLNSFEVYDLEGKAVQFPIAHKKMVYVFWATWCLPCHQQMKLFKSAIDDGELKKDQIVALSMGESLDTVNSYLQKNHLVFPVFVDPSGRSWGAFNVKATPSIAFVTEQGIVEYFTAGYSPLAIMRAKSFF